MKHENDLKVNKCYPNVWLSPDGNFYNGYAHEICITVSYPDGISLKGLHIHKCVLKSVKFYG